jgi:hypothetical protein
MKEIEKKVEYPSLVEVWEWKDAAAKELEGKTDEEIFQLRHQTMIECAKIIGATLVKLPNGNYKFA